MIESNKVAMLYGWDLTEVCKTAEFGPALLADLGNTVIRGQPACDSPVIHLYGSTLFVGLLMHEVDDTPNTRIFIDSLIEQAERKSIQRGVIVVTHGAFRRMLELCETCESDVVRQTIHDTLGSEPTFSAVRYSYPEMTND